jgi:predicted unusual protein kinase regulating ubiquinone biosynthesis (AarF/ABC1/UbiB family)
VVADSGEILATGVEGELLAAKLGPMIGVEVPAVARITVRGEQGAVDGIAIRWVDDHVKLQNATIAQMLHAKQQIAEVKAMRAFIADHDGHDGNLLLLRNGKVVSIDHGMAALLEEGFRNPTDSSEQARAIIRRAMERRAAVAGEQHPNIRLIDKYIRYEDMEGVVNKITQLSETQLRELVQAAYAGSGATPHEINLALENLRIRQQLLPEVMRQRYPPAKPPAAPPPEPSAP